MVCPTAAEKRAHHLVKEFRHKTKKELPKHAQYVRAVRMPLKSSLSLDLNKAATPDQRDRCYAKLAEFYWVKDPQASSLWTCTWSAHATADNATAATKRQIAEAAQAGGITAYDATMSFTSVPEHWNQNG
jgi:hypothetical protein